MKGFLRPTLHPGLQLVLLVGLMVAGLSLASFAAVFVAGRAYGIGAADFNAAMTDPAAHPGVWGLLMWFQGLSLAGLGAGAAVLPLVLGTSWAAYFAPRRPVRPGWLLGAAGLIVVIVPFMSAVVAWNAGAHFPAFLHDFEAWAKAKEDQATVLTRYLTQFTTGARLLVGLLVVAVVPAVAEELTFRGVIQRNLVQWLGSRHAGVWVAAAVFSAIHVQFFGFVPRFLLGLVLGYLYEWSGNILVPMAAHFTQNALQLVLVYLAQHGRLGWGFDPDSTEPLAWPWVAASAVATGVALFGVHRLLTDTGPAKTISSQGVSV